MSIVERLQELTDVDFERDSAVSGRGVAEGQVSDISIIAIKLPR